MIERYSHPEMASIWSLENQFQAWLKVELYACEGWHQIGKISDKDLAHILKSAKFDIKEVCRLEEETKHDMAAFVSNVQSYVGEAGRYIHLGLTSSDVIDTAFAYRMVESSKLIQRNLDGLLNALKKRSLEFKNLLTIGRTHGIHAEPMVFGTKFLLWYDQVKRALNRLRLATEEIRVGKISGAVGNYAQVPPEVENHVCQKLGLQVDSISTQVISRDRFASYFFALAQIGASIEVIALEIRHLQRSEVGEVKEGFTKGQKGSSAMPHKRNPILSENLTGLSRLLRSTVIPALENCPLWHERDISHSSVERVMAPDANILCDFMIRRATALVENLEVDQKAVEKNRNLTQGTFFSQKVLLSMIDKGWSRDKAYSLVQKAALKSLDSQTPFKKNVMEAPEVAGLFTATEIDNLFSTEPFIRYGAYLYEKVLGV